MMWSGQGICLKAFRSRHMTTDSSFGADLNRQFRYPIITKNIVVLWQFTRNRQYKPQESRGNFSLTIFRSLFTPVY
jgi:hypothetical protein